MPSTRTDAVRDGRRGRREGRDHVRVADQSANELVENGGRLHECELQTAKRADACAFKRRPRILAALAESMDRRTRVAFAKTLILCRRKAADTLSATNFSTKGRGCFVAHYHAMRIFYLLVVAAAIALTNSAVAGTHRSRRQETRTVKTLSLRRFMDTSWAQGLGYTKAGELNHYPGPRHVLDLANALESEPPNNVDSAAIYGRMHAEVVPLGEMIVTRERRLNVAFATGSMERSEPLLWKRPTSPS